MKRSPKAKTPKEIASEVLEALEAFAPRLIAAGVTSFAIDGLSATLAPPPPKPGELPKAIPPPPTPVDPLLDPATYPGGRVPGFTREEQ